MWVSLRLESVMVTKWYHGGTQRAYHWYVSKLIELYVGCSTDFVLSLFQIQRQLDVDILIYGHTHKVVNLRAGQEKIIICFWSEALC